MAESPDAHRRLTVTPATDCGSPASSAAMRATLRLSSPAWLAQPRQTSSISSAGTPERSPAGAADRRADRGEQDGARHVGGVPSFITAWAIANALLAAGTPQ